MEPVRATVDLVERPRVRTLLIDHAAQLLGVSRRTVYNRIREGRLRTIRTRCGTQRVLVESAVALLREGRRARRAIPAIDDRGADRSAAS